MIKLSVILASYNTRTMTLDCLEKLQDNLEKIESEIWVVDNASNDGSAEAIAANFPHIHLIASEQNLGFGAANNLAMSRATGRMYLLLNTDAFLHSDALNQLICYLDANSQVGAVGPCLLNGDGSHQESIHDNPSAGQSWAHVLGLSRLKARFPSQPIHRTGIIKKDKYLKGACLLLRREVWEQVGGFDEKFFFYGEDGDWGRRIILQGFDVAYLDEAKVTHLSGKSSRHWMYSTLNNYAAMEYMVWKQQGTPGVLSVHTSWVVYATRVWIQHVALALIHRRRPDPAIVTLCRWMIRLSCTYRDFTSPGFTTRLPLPEGF